MARNRWIEDRSRLAAVESLVARRVAAALQERRRRENREQDEIGTDLWRRSQTVAGGIVSVAEVTSRIGQIQAQLRSAGSGPQQHGTVRAPSSRPR